MVFPRAPGTPHRCHGRSGPSQRRQHAGDPQPALHGTLLARKGAWLAGSDAWPLEQGGRNSPTPPWMPLQVAAPPLCSRPPRAPLAAPGASSGKTRCPAELWLGPPRCHPGVRPPPGSAPRARPAPLGPAAAARAPLRPQRSAARRRRPLRRRAPRLRQPRPRHPQRRRGTERARRLRPRLSLPAAAAPMGQPGTGRGEGGSKATSLFSGRALV
jgi:hypothetical protein